MLVILFILPPSLLLGFAVKALLKWILGPERFNQINVFESRLGELLLLGCIALHAGLCFWYLVYYCIHHPAHCEDDTTAFVFIMAAPSYLIGAVFAAVGLFRLGNLLRRLPWTPTNIALAISGTLLALVGMSPLPAPFAIRSLHLF
jgi:hypothetical protein